MKRDDVIRYLRENDDYDAFCRLMGAGTLVGFKVALYYMHDKLGYNRIHALVLIEPNLYTGYALKKETLIFPDFCDVDVEYLKYDNKKSRSMIDRLMVIKHNMQNVRNIGRELFLCGVDNLDYAFASMIHCYTSYRIVSVKIDEGFDYWRFFFKPMSMIIRRFVLGLYVKSCFNWIKECLFCTYHHSKQFDMRAYAGDNFRTGRLRSYLLKAITDGKRDIISSNDKYVIYMNTQPLDPDECRKNQIANTVLKRLQKEGYRVYIKNHPRMPQGGIAEGADYSVIPAEYSGESVVGAATVKPSFVLGWYTSTLYIISDNWDIPCLCLYGLYNVKDISDDASVMGKFIRRYRPNNMYMYSEELMEELMSC